MEAVEAATSSGICCVLFCCFLPFSLTCLQTKEIRQKKIKIKTVKADRPGKSNTAPPQVAALCFSTWKSGFKTEIQGRDLTEKERGL